MKINYKNTALRLLEHCDPYSFQIAATSETMPQEFATTLGMDIVRQWPLVVDCCKQKIQYISAPFYEAYNQATEKMAGVIDAQDIMESGVFIMRASQSETNTIFYNIGTEGKGDNWKIMGFVFIFNNKTDREKPSMAIYVQRNNKGIKEYMSKKAIESGCTNISVLADILTMILFMKYCEVETKLVKANKKEIHIGTKYVNETKSNIEILDSTWFTTIVRSDGFKVRGHFRFQPVGINHADRKLIWISDFDKTGFTRKAKILTQQDADN